MWLRLKINDSPSSQILKQIDSLFEDSRIILHQGCVMSDGIAIIIHPSFASLGLGCDGSRLTGYETSSLQRGLDRPGGLPPCWTCPKSPQGRPPQLAPFNMKQQRISCELPPDVRAPHPISEEEPRQPTEETHFGGVYPQSILLSLVNGTLRGFNCLASGGTSPHLDPEAVIHHLLAETHNLRPLSMHASSKKRVTILGSPN